MDLDLRLVRYFVAVAEELHFGRAATRLFLSQPALSKQIRKLEDQLGTPLLLRDSRHVELTPRGQVFLGEARQLLALADTMQRPGRTGAVRVAHVFELDTSRAVVDTMVRAHPEVEVLQFAMDSQLQLQALLQHRLDVAILRVTPQMVRVHPTGWQHHPLRFEPLLLVGHPGDEVKPTASLHEVPLAVFGDPPDSGSYNAHGHYLSAFEAETGIRMRWIGTPGAFSLCLAQASRSTTATRYLEFASYAHRYAEAGFRVYRPEELQPYYPWSIAWRTGEKAQATADLLAVATGLARDSGWLEVATTPAGWLPADEPVRLPG